MALDLDKLKKEDIAGHLEQGNENLIGVTVPINHFEGKELKEAVRGWCTLNLWIEHNSDWKVRYEYAFENGAQYRVLLIDKKTGDIAKDFGWSDVKGVAISEANFGNTFEQLGFKMAFKLARQIEADIKNTKEVIK